MFPVSLAGGACRYGLFLALSIAAVKVQRGKLAFHTNVTHSPRTKNMGVGAMRTYLVVIDDSPEASIALRFAARRAARTGGGVAVLAIVTPQDFVAFGAVQATIEAEAREHAEELVAAAADAVVQEAGVTPQIMVKSGKPADVVREVINASDEIAALVLATAANGAPGPLVAHFTGQDAGTLPCPVMIVPGGIDLARLDALS
jgi:nucleotide-binding universal stress UspA family protein